MKRIDSSTVEFTDEELLVTEIFELLLDQGYSQGTAVDLIFGCSIPGNLRSETPNLDKVMTADFVAYLRE